jgi:phosphoribosylanthranilate isomerase
MKIKVCGLMRPEDVRLSCELGAWGAGLIFAPDSPRRLRREQAMELRAEVAPGTLAIGVFQGNGREEILKTIKDCRLDAIQLYAATKAELKDYPVPILWAMAHKTDDIPDGLLGVLVEPPRDSGDRIRGKKPDAILQADAWRAARSLKKPGRLVVVAGGLEPGNVAQAAKAAEAGGVDVSSGVESKPGAKDANKLRAFFAAVR